MRRALLALPLLLLVVPALAVPGPAGRELGKVLEGGDAARIRAVFAELRGQLDAEQTKALIRAIGPLYAAGLYEELVALLGEAHGPALEELAGAYRSGRTSERFLVLDALGRNPDPLADATLGQAAREDREEAVAVYALRALARRGTARAVGELIGVLEESARNRRKAQLASEALAALQGLTGQDHVEPADWRRWWETGRAEWERGRRGPAPGEGGDDGRTRTRTVLDRMRENDPRGLTTLTRLRGDEIVVVEGAFDECEKVLAALKLPHQVHPRERLAELELDPSKQVLVLNCSADDDQPPAVAEKIRRFVAEGGYLFASDWELTSILARAFPECVTSAGRDAPETKVAIQPVGGRPSAHPLLRDVFPLNPLETSPGGLSWQVDAVSEFMKPHPAIVVLVEAPELRVPIVACTFGFTPRGPVSGEPWAAPRTGGGGGTRAGGRRGGDESARLPGRVVYVMSHFKHQGDEAGDGFALQQLLLNLVIEKQEMRRALEGR